MAVQQRVAVLEFSQEKMSACPTPPSCSCFAYCLPKRLVLFFQGNKLFFSKNLLFEKKISVSGIVKGREGWHAAVHGVQRVRCPWATNNNNKGLSASFLPSCLPACLSCTYRYLYVYLLPSSYWGSNTLATWWEKLTHWKRLWCWERLKAGGEADDREWDGWMASMTRWPWVWASSGSWWWTGKPGVLQSTGLQRIGHNWATELNFLIYTESWCLTLW